MEANVSALRATLDAFAQAWSARDLDRIMDCLTEDCVYGASVGPEPGRTYRGRAAVRDGIAAMIALDNTIRAEIGNFTISGDRAFWEWRYYGRDVDGRDTVRHGCDLFEFEGGKIKRKQAFRKVVGP